MDARRAGRGIGGYVCTPPAVEKTKRKVIVA
jgi:hypothetical protein